MKKNIKNYTKHKKIWFILLGTIFILSFIILKNQFYKTTFHSLNQTDQKMLSQLNMLYSGTELKEKRLWKQYELPQIPVILVRKGDWFNFSQDTINLIRKDAYAIGVKGLEHKWYAKKIKLPDSYHLPDVYRLSALTPGIWSTWNPIGNFQSIGTDMKLGDSSDVYFMKYNKKNLEDAAKPSQYFVPFLSHELFHYTMQNDWVVEKEVSITDKTDEWFAYLGLQYASLDALLSKMNSYNLKEFKKVLADYITISEYRRRLNPVDFAEEKKHETAEGTATYVGMKASVFADTPKLKLLTGADSDENRKFSVLFKAIAENSGYTSEIKWNRYDSGALLCMILDKLYHSHVWQDSLNAQSIKRPVTLYDLIKDYYKSYSLEEYARSIEELQEIYNFSEIKIQAKKITEQSN